MGQPASSFATAGPPDSALLSRLRGIVGRHGWVAGEAVAPYMAEARGRFRGVAAAVVRPSCTAEVAALVGACAEAGVAIVPQSGNTGLVGGALPSADGSQVLMNLGRMNRIRALDVHSNTVTAEAGCVLTDVQRAAAAADRSFPLSFAAEGVCQIGGNLATNAGGVHVLRYGNARALTLGLEVVLADGRVWDGLRGVLKNNAGYALKDVFVGSEGTLGIIAAATLRLFPRPRQIVTAAVAAPSLAAALDAMGALQAASGGRLAACEAMSDLAVDLALTHEPNARRPFAEPAGWSVLTEFHGGGGHDLKPAVRGGLAELRARGTVSDAVLAESEAEAEALWRVRKGIPGAQTREGGSIKHDIAVPPHRMPAFVEEAAAAVREAVPGVRVCAFGHLGDGNLHFNLQQPEGGDRDGFLAQWERLARIVHDCATAHGGSIAAEHGVGLAKVAELARLHSGVEVDLMRRLKAALDPAGILNPGKVVDCGPEAVGPGASSAARPPPALESRGATG